MHSSLLLPSLSLLYAVAQAGTTVQHPFRLPTRVPPNTCRANGIFSPENSCAVAKPLKHHHNHAHHEDHEHHEHHHFPSHSHPSHKPSLDDLFDDFKDPDTANPWTHTPACLSDTNNQTYCVYTNTNYANGRGISFFTTPEIADYVVTLPAFANNPLPPHVNNWTDVPYEIRNIPGRGNGVFATKRLERGDVILAETPVGVYMSDAFFPDHDLGYEYLRKTYERLPAKTREEFEKLSMHNEGHPIMERVNTNAFAGEFGEDAHFWVHPQTAMLNHDCRPNAMYYTEGDSFVHTTVASSTIEPGEEITITYINLLETRADREELLKIWGFSCSCALCTSTSTANLASEARVAKITELQDLLMDWTSSSSASPELAEKLIKLYAKENLHAAKGTGHMFAALAYNALGEEGESMEMAKWHAQMAIDAGTVGSGDLGKDRKEMRELIERPKKHWSWGERRRR